MDTRIENKYAKVTGNDGEIIVANFFSGGRIESPHPVEVIDIVDGVLHVTGLNSEVIDSNLKDFAKTDIPAEIIRLEDSPRTKDSDEAVSELVNKGIIIITPTE